MSIFELLAIKLFPEHQLRNDAHFQFYAEFCALVEQFGAALLKIDELWPGFLVLFANLDAALKKIVKSVLTDKIKDADAARDSVFAGIVKLNKVVLEHHYDPAHREAAQQVDVVLHTYGNIAAKPINEETSAVYNLVQELLSDKYKAHVTLVGLLPWVTKLGELNDSLESLIQQRDRESASKNHVAMRTARNEIDKAYRHIIQTINSLIYLKQLPGSEAFVDTLNTINHRYATMIKRQRGGRGAHGENVPETEEGAGTEGTEGNGAV